MLSRNAIGLMFALLASTAAAQTATHTIDWIEVYANSNTPVANPNGVIEPGEAALLRVSVSFDPPVGSQLIYPGGVGAVAGFGGSAFGFSGPGITTGTLSHFAAAPGFQLSFVPNVILGSHQNIPIHPALPETANPIPDFWQAVWTPSTYDPRHVSLPMVGIQGTGGHWLTDMLLQVGVDPTTGHPQYVRHSFQPTMVGNAEIPIIPSPGAAIPLVAGFMAMSLRRRRRSTNERRTLVMLRRISVTLSAAFLASTAAAQTAEHTLEWIEVEANTKTPVANPNGILEPGESVLFRVSVSFDPPVGSQLPYPGGIGTVAGFGGSHFSWRWTGNIQGTWGQYAAAPGFQLFPDPNGFWGASQPIPTYPAVPSPINPVPLWEVVWTPASYEPRQVSHWIQGISGTGGSWLTAIMLQTGIDPTTGHPQYANTNFAPTMLNTVQIPIIPSPGAAIPLAALFIASCTRRRPKL